MIFLKKGQPLFADSGMVVYDQTGYYDDGASVICAMAFSPETPVYRYEAKFIAYGGKVYSISDPDQLLEEVKKLDPTSLLGTDSAQIALDQKTDQIVTSQPDTLTTTASTTPALAPTTEKVDTSTSTPNLPNLPISEALETVPSPTTVTPDPTVIVPEPTIVTPDVSSSTLPMTDPVVPIEVASSTPEVSSLAATEDIISINASTTSTGFPVIDIVN